MKSEDIIKAMMQCYAMDCDGCPFRDKNDCGKCEELIPIAIDLLKKQNEELAAYRAAEQDGTLIRTPCKVGDTVWILCNVFDGNEQKQVIGSRTITEINHNKLNKNTMISKNPFELHFFPSEIGKTVFLTREAAEAALKEQEGQK